jgi:hypothetical protein
MPTDRELQDVWNNLYWEAGEQATPMIYRFARAVLERWGNQPGEIPEEPEYSPVSDW